jgi:N-acetyl-anhydromuramyl-L-alanine amidase AmpD
MRIVDKPIPFGQDRKQLTLDYIRRHHDPQASSITIEPQMIVVHWTASCSLRSVLSAFEPTSVSILRWEIFKEGRLNVSSQFVVDREGTVYRLMPENWFARHTIGLNWAAIGIENVGAPWCPLTIHQLSTCAELIRELAAKYSSIRYLIGHHEYLKFRNTPLWKESNPDYVTKKRDPGDEFMSRLRKELAASGRLLLSEYR